MDCLIIGDPAAFTIQRAMWEITFLVAFCSSRGKKTANFFISKPFFLSIFFFIQTH